MSLTPEYEEAGDRVLLVNDGAYDPTLNRYGLGRGGNSRGVFVGALRDFILYARGTIGFVSTRMGEVRALALRFEDAVEAIEAGPVTSVVGKSGAVSAEEIAAALDLPAVRPAFTVSPANGTTPALPGGALVLAVSGFYSDYGKRQKSIRFQIDDNANFASPELDQTFVTPSTSVQVPNAQTVFQGGVTYYVRSNQTDEDDKSGDWSAATSFTFPVVPNAATMTAPADGATGQGAQNNPIAFAASAYSHPNNIPRQSRVFELSTTATFAAIVTSLTAASGSSAASLSAPRDVLQPNTLYYVRCRDTDTNGATSTSAVTTFRTVTAFRPSIGEAYQGGTFAGQSGGQDIILADKSTRIAGTFNAAKISASDLVSNGYDDWVIGTRAQYRVVSENLRGMPNFAPGGAQSFDSGIYWTSEANETAEGPYPYTINLSNGSEAFENEANTRFMRAVRLVTP